MTYEDLGPLREPPLSNTGSTTPTAHPETLLDHERTLINTAANRAETLYPGPVGKYLSRDLQHLALCGFRVDQSGLTAQLIHHLTTPPTPQPHLCEPPTAA